MFQSPGALTFGYGYTFLVGVDVGAGDVEVRNLYIIHHERPIHIRYSVPYKNKVQLNN